MNMLNTRQLASLWGGIISITIMGLVPPWRESAGAGNPLSYAPLFDPSSLHAATGVMVDYSRLSVQWILALVITGGLIASFQKALAVPPLKSTSAPERLENNSSNNKSPATLKTVRTLTFPQSSVGLLLVDSDDDEEYWEYYSQAAGAVAVPVDKRLQFELIKDSDTNISQLKSLPPDAFYSLDFSGSRVSDADLTHVGHFSDLREIDLSDTSVTDLGIKSLVGLAKLKKIWLDNTSVTDKGLEELTKHREIEKVSLIGTHIDDAVAKSLVKAFPGSCELVLEENG